MACVIATVLHPSWAPTPQPAQHHYKATSTPSTLSTPCIPQPYRQPSLAPAPPSARAPSSPWAGDLPQPGTASTGCSLPIIPNPPLRITRLTHAPRAETCPLSDGAPAFVYLLHPSGYRRRDLPDQGYGFSACFAHLLSLTRCSDCQLDCARHHGGVARSARQSHGLQSFDRHCHHRATAVAPFTILRVRRTRDPPHAAPPPGEIG
jgi:hypothetical protein